MPTLARLCPASSPAVDASPLGLLDSPICFSDWVGSPGSLRTSPPSWSVISSSGSLTGLCALAWLSCWTTEEIWVSLEMLSPKKITPAASPASMRWISVLGGVRPE
jgi:hypothetical protein